MPNVSNGTLLALSTTMSRVSLPLYASRDLVVSSEFTLMPSKTFSRRILNSVYSRYCSSPQTGLPARSKMMSLGGGGGGGGGVSGQGPKKRATAF